MPFGSPKNVASVAEGEQMTHRALIALLIVFGLAATAPARAEPARTRAPTATTVPVAVAWGRAVASLLEVQDTLYSQHDAWWERLSGLETMCETAKEEESTLPDAAEAMWKSLAGGVDNNSKYYGRVINPLLKKLKRAAIKLNADFGKKFTAKEASRLAAGTADIARGVDKWSEADAEATFGELALTTHHNCGAGHGFLVNANSDLLSSLRLMEAGSEELTKVFS